MSFQFYVPRQDYDWGCKILRGRNDRSTCWRRYRRKIVVDLTAESGGADFWDLVRKDETQEHLMRARYEEVGNQLMILKVPEFFFSAGEVEGMIPAGLARIRT